MCYTIKSDNLLANYFANSQAKNISFKRLKQIRREIEGLFDHNIYVDITYVAVQKAINSNENLFTKKDDGIFLKAEAIKAIKKTDFVEEHFNWRIPIDIKEKYLEYFLEMQNE